MDGRSLPIDLSSQLKRLNTENFQTSENASLRAMGDIIRRFCDFCAVVKVSRIRPSDLL